MAWLRLLVAFISVSRTTRWTRLDVVTFETEYISQSMHSWKYGIKMAAFLYEDQVPLDMTREISRMHVRHSICKYISYPRRVYAHTHVCIVQYVGSSVVSYPRLRNRNTSARHVIGI